MWINRIISKRAHVRSKIIFILRSNKFLACLERVRSYAWSFGHSDPEPSSVYVLCLYRTGKQTYCARLIDKSLSVRFYASQRPVERTISRYVSTVLGQNIFLFQYLTLVFIFSCWVDFKKIK